MSRFCLTTRQVLEWAQLYRSYTESYSILLQQQRRAAFNAGWTSIIHVLLYEHVN